MYYKILKTVYKICKEWVKEKGITFNLKKSKCDDPAGRHLGRDGPTDSPQKEQCGRAVHTVQAHWARGAKTRSPYNQ